jgi:hypothetical protein
MVMPHGSCSCHGLVGKSATRPYSPLASGRVVEIHARIGDTVTASQKSHCDYLQLREPSAPGLA